jgi:uncharacterized protein (DUF58 family)
MAPRASRQITERVAETLVADRSSLDDDLPPRAAVATLDEVVMISDFLSPVDQIASVVDGISGRGARGHLALIVDPVEETFPFQGQAVLHDLEIGVKLRIGDADSWGTAYRERMARHRAELDEVVRRRGWTLTIHRTDRSINAAALRLMTLVASSRGTTLGMR